MNRTTEHGQQQDEKRQRPAATGPDRMASEPQEKTGAPDAVRAAKVARGEKSEQATEKAGRRARGVDWVRPTDLVARQSAALAGRGIDFELELARRTRAPIKAGARHLSERARRLPDVSEFGRGSRSQSWVSRSGIGLG